MENIRGCYTKPGFISFVWKKLEVYRVSLLPETQNIRIIWHIRKQQTE